MAVVRLTPSGGLDSLFGVGGYAATSVSTPAVDGAVDSYGRIVAVGFEGMTVARFNSWGALDSGFGNAGIVSGPGPSDLYGSGVRVDDQNRVVTAGYIQQGSDADAIVARYLIDGTPDPEWGTVGVVTTK
jgi:uncharacterized delta-60 repeat protein